MKNNKKSDEDIQYNSKTLLFDEVKKLKKAKFKHGALWYSSKIFVLIFSFIAALYDGLNLYSSPLSSLLQGNYLLSIVLCVGVTIMLNFGASVLADMYSFFKDKRYSIQRWQVLAFMTILILLFISVFSLRYATAERPFSSPLESEAAGLGDFAVTDSTVTLPVSTTIIFATLVNFSSIASSAICFVVSLFGYQRSKEEKKLEDEMYDIDIKKLIAYELGARCELDDVNFEELQKMDFDREVAAEQGAGDKCVEMAQVFRTHLQEHLSTPSDVSVVSDTAHELNKKHEEATERSNVL